MFIRPVISLMAVTLAILLGSVSTARDLDVLFLGDAGNHQPRLGSNSYSLCWRIAAFAWSTPSRCRI